MNKLVAAILWAAVMLGAFWAFTSASPEASADPADPHQPNWSIGWCPGGGSISMNANALPNIGGMYGHCDGVPYPDGSYLHQVPQNNGLSGFGVTVQTFCRVNPGSFWSPPAGPGGCDGAA